MKIILFNTFVSIIITILCFSTHNLGSGNYVEYTLPGEFIKYYSLGIIPTALIISLILGEKDKNFDPVIFFNKVILGDNIKDYESKKISNLKIVLLTLVNLSFYFFIYYFMYKTSHHFHK